jgi:hypothetical protein
VSSDDIAGEYSVETEGGSTRALNPASRQQDAVQIVQTFVPLLMQAGFDPTNLLRTALSDWGLDPDHVLIRPSAAPVAPAAPEIPGQGPAGVDPMAGLQALGGPPVPAATSGGMA